MEMETRINKIIKWIGSVNSLILHTVIFVVSFLLYFLGFDMEKILLFITTIVSLEAIYLAIFIQMSINIQSKKLEDVQEDVGDIQEDVDELQKDIQEIQKDVEEINEDEDYDKVISNIEEKMSSILAEITKLRNKKN